MAISENWYAVRVRPGSQRMAKQGDAECAPEHKRGETIVERECRQEGVRMFMPAVWLCILKHRSRKFTLRRLPLYTGYAFVNIPGGDFERVRDSVDSITAFLRQNRYSAPAVFAEPIISRLALDDFERYQTCRYELLERQELLKEQRVREIRAEQSRIRQRSVAGRGRRKNKLFTQEVEQLMIEKMDVETQARWQALGRELKALEDVDSPIELPRKIA